MYVFAANEPFTQKSQVIHAYLHTYILRITIVQLLRFVSATHNNSAAQRCEIYATIWQQQQHEKDDWI